MTQREFFGERIQRRPYDEMADLCHGALRSLGRDEREAPRNNSASVLRRNREGSHP